MARTRVQAAQGASPCSRGGSFSMSSGSYQSMGAAPPWPPPWLLPTPSAPEACPAGCAQSPMLPDTSPVSAGEASHSDVVEGSNTCGCCVTVPAPARLWAEAPPIPPSSASSPNQWSPESPSGCESQGGVRDSAFHGVGTNGDARGLDGGSGLRSRPAKNGAHTCLAFAQGAPQCSRRPPRAQTWPRTPP